MWLNAATRTSIGAPTTPINALKQTEINTDKVGVFRSASDHWWWCSNAIKYLKTDLPLSGTMQTNPNRQRFNAQSLFVCGIKMHTTQQSIRHHCPVFWPTTAARQTPTKVRRNRMSDCMQCIIKSAAPSGDGATRRRCIRWPTNIESTRLPTPAAARVIQAETKPEINR